jgi:hypothetical protein
MTLPEYVDWARRKVQELGLRFDGTPDAITAMARDRCPHRGDLFLDYGVAGNVMTREGLGALIKEAVTDRDVSHVLIPRRDRLARPDDPVDAVKLEGVFRDNGITLVFMDRTVPPAKKGQRRDIGELIATLVDYEKSGKDRRELAEKMVYAQLRLAGLGFSVGGRPPYGFRRWLAREDGTAVRQLEDGERVRLPGHHVVWLPGPEAEVAVIRRILAMLETLPASRVAARLTAEGVPTPDYGRTRTDGGVKHPTAGVWGQAMVTNIARNPLVGALVSYGRRSMGDQARYSPQGPRPLEDADRNSEGQPRVVRNPEGALITRPSPVQFEPLIDPERQRQLIALLDERGGTQRGKPRAGRGAQPAGKPGLRHGLRLADVPAAARRVAPLHLRVVHAESRRAVRPQPPRRANRGPLPVELCPPARAGPAPPGEVGGAAYRIGTPGIGRRRCEVPVAREGGCARGSPGAAGEGEPQPGTGGHSGAAPRDRGPL